MKKYPKISTLYTYEFTKKIKETSKKKMPPKYGFFPNSSYYMLKRENILLCLHCPLMLLHPIRFHRRHTHHSRPPLVSDCLEQQHYVQ